MDYGLFSQGLLNYSYLLYPILKECQVKSEMGQKTARMNGGANAGGKVDSTGYSLEIMTISAQLSEKRPEQQCRRRRKNRGKAAALPQSGHAVFGNDLIHCDDG